MNPFTRALKRQISKSSRTPCATQLLPLLLLLALVAGCASPRPRVRHLERTQPASRTNLVHIDPHFRMRLAPAAAVQAQFTYTTNNGTITIIGSAPSTYFGRVVTIPDTINGLPVTSIGTTAFDSRKPGDRPMAGAAWEDGGGPYSIPDFSQDSSRGSSYVLFSVEIPKSVTNIGKYAFDNCPGLTTINVDPANSFYSSVNGVLFDIHQSTLIQYPAGMGGNYMIPASVTSIGDIAFYASGLTNVTIPNSVTNIGDHAFSFCKRLASVTIPNSVSKIRFGTFSCCDRLASVTIPNSVTSIGDGAFADSGLTSVTIPNSVTTIGDMAFFACDNLKGVYFQGNAPTLGRFVFDSDRNAVVYYLPGKAGWRSSFGGRPTKLWRP